MPLPKLLITAGLMAANMALSMSRKIEGPRLDDLKFTSGDYGASLPLVWGKRRMQTPIFWAEDLREVKRRRKTKGGKYNEYTYYGTWAVALAGHEIEAVTRIWFDTHLVFDLTGAGPVTPFDFGDTAASKPFAASATGGQSWASYMAIYTGTETQEPDPRMQATVEAAQGEGSCPAYRGTAYIVFKDVPLEKLGNRIPQVSVEFVGAGAGTTILTQDVESPSLTLGWSNARFSPDFSHLILTYDDKFEIWDTVARACLVYGPLPVPGLYDPRNYVKIGVYSSGAWLQVCDLGSKLYRMTADGGSYVELQDFGADNQDGVTVLMDGSGQEHWLTYPPYPYDIFFVDGASFAETPLVPTHYFADSYGDIWGIFREEVAIDYVTFIRLVDGGGGIGWPSRVTVSGLDTLTRPACYGKHVKTNVGDHFILQWGGTINVIEPNTGTVTNTYSAGTLASSTVLDAIWDNIPPGFGSIWIRGNEIDLVTGELIRSAVISTTTLDRVIYDAVNHALIGEAHDGTSTSLTWNYLDRVIDSGVTLESIANGIAAQVDVSGYDFSDLDQTITGWSATQGQASAMLEPLLDAYDADIRPHGFIVEGVKRAGVSGGTLLTERFTGSPRYSVKVRQAAELPRALTVSFADTDGDQQVNNTRAGRPLDATGARGEKSLDLSTLALSVDAARGLGDRFFRRMWNERKEVSFGLTAQQIALEPGDVRTLDLDGETMRARLVKVTVKADDTLTTEWRYDSPSLATLTTAAGAGFDGRTPSVIIVPLVSKGFVLDIPLLTDADSLTTPIVYLAAAPYATGAWPGASFFQAIDGDYSDEIASVASSSQAAWGYATDVLADANPNLWDRGNSVNVRLQVGALSGTTETVINAAASTNLALIGNELVNFTTATLEGDGSYTLSGFKRGRRGTEWATGGHAERDVFLLLDTAETEAMGLSEVGTDLSFKAITSGRSESSAFPIDLSFTGASLKPYAPCHLAAVMDGADWDLSWVRRTRVGGAWTSGTSISLSEAAEEYEIEIMDGATVKRTVTGLTSPAYTYLSADQTTDFGAPLTSAPSFRVYQISDAVGRGFVAAI